VQGENVPEGDERSYKELLLDERLHLAPDLLILLGLGHELAHRGKRPGIFVMGVEENGAELDVQQADGEIARCIVMVERVAVDVVPDPLLKACRRSNSEQIFFFPRVRCLPCIADIDVEILK